MGIAEMIPTLDDAALANLHENAARLGASGEGPRQKQAAELLPLIEAELASRKAAKPKPARAVKKKAVSKKAAAKKAAAEAETEA